MRTLLGVAVLAFSFSCLGESNPPAPSAHESEQNQREHAKKPDQHAPAQDKPASASPVSLTAITSGNNAQQPQKPEERSSAEWWALGVSAIAAVIALIAAGIAGAQMWMFKKQLGLMGTSNKTAALAAKAAEESAKATLIQTQSAMDAERAYVKLSHLEPGIERLDDQSSVVKIEVKNWGRTPAHITDVIIGFKKLDFGTPLPIPYPYSDAQRESFPNGFLVPNELLYVDRHVTTRQVSDTSKQLWIFGHVDYIDIFDRRWRGGYARKYVSMNDNNLIYNTEGRDNFDRERTPDEGRDWNEKSIAAYNARKKAPVVTER